MTDVRTISTQELHERLDHHQESLELWNVQSDSRFEGEVIPGSRRMPLDSIEIGSSAVPKDAEIVTYCGGPDCSQGVEAVQRLADVGYTNLSVYSDGLSGWKSAGYGTAPPRRSPAT